MIKTALIALAASASLGASSQTASHTPVPSTPAHIEISAGPLSIIRDGGKTQFDYVPNSSAALRIKIGERKSLNIQF